MIYDSILTAVICYSIYRASKYFIISWRVPLGYILLGVCVLASWRVGSFHLGVNIGIGIALFALLVWLLGTLAVYYTSNPIRTHLSVIGLVSLSLFIKWSTVINEVSELAEKLM